MTGRGAPPTSDCLQGSQCRQHSSQISTVGNISFVFLSMLRNISAEKSEIELFRALNSARNNSFRIFSAAIFWGEGGALRRNINSSTCFLSKLVSFFEPRPRAHVVENGVRERRLGNTRWVQSGTFRFIRRVHLGTFGYIWVHLGTCAPSETWRGLRKT